MEIYEWDIWHDFWSRVNVVPNKCWPWKGRPTPAGYGYYKVDGRQQHAHRIAYQLARGPIPLGQFVCHHCDNRICVNPDHLFLGTHEDNMRDATVKGRMGPPKNFGKRRPRITQEQITEVCELWKAGWTQKQIALKLDLKATTVNRTLYKVRHPDEPIVQE